MADNEKIKEILNDPAKLEAELKKFFAEMDKEKKVMSLLIVFITLLKK